ncbi:MAG TPA: hypothetical protein PLR05_06475, partial [Acinetobacter johnsonii]|nr:hypothetical protein [Acinetobacter johnsonii]
HLPKLRLKFSSIRGALHFQSLCNEAYHIASDSHHLHSGFVRKLEATLRQRVSNGTGVILEINSNADLYYQMLSSYIAEHDRFSVVQSLKEVS